MTSYEELNDYELVDAAQEFNEDALELLHNKYRPVIVKKCKKVSLNYVGKGFSLSDLILECTLIFEEAIHKFLPDEQANFYTFVNVCLDRGIISFLRMSLNSKNKILNDSIPLESDDDENINMIDFIPDNSNNPDSRFERNENINNLCEKIVNELTSLEECVFKLKLQNYSYKEIADILDKDKKSIDNAIQRIKIKINGLLENKNIEMPPIIL